MLFSDVDGLNNENWIKPPLRRRRDSNSAPGARTRLEIQDILSMYSFVDEHKLFDQLPTYVGSDLSLIPTMKLEDGDVKCFLAKLDKVTVSHDELNHNFLNLVSYLSKIEDHLKGLETLITDLSSQLKDQYQGARIKGGSD